MTASTSLHQPTDAPMFARTCFCCVLLCSVALSQTSENAADQKFYDLLAEEWENRMRESPLWATRTGDHRFNDQLPKISIADMDRRVATSRKFLASSEAIPNDGLSKKAKLDKQLFERQTKQGLESYKFKEFLIPITNRSGFHIDFPDTRLTSPLNTTTDYENFIARMRQFKTYAEQHMAMMREGIEQGLTLPAVVLQGYAEPIESQIVTDPEKSLLFEPFQEISKNVPEAEHARLREESKTAIKDSVVPGYQAFLDFMREEYVPSCRGSVGASAMPNGRAYYRFCVKKFTTLPLTPEEVHNTGLAEVERIRGEMDEIRKRVKFDGDFPAFLDHLRTDKKYYAQSKEELLKETALVLKRMDGLLPELFKTLPRTPYGIREVPEYIAPQTTAAYYMVAAGDGSKAGFYYVNTYNLASRPLYSVQALSQHEAVPGHHLQLALQQEMKDTPEFRKFARFTAYVEGWALYAERLGLEVGFYEDPYDDFGRLTYEIWRACRLVVDTGIHYFGWTRQRAIKFMEENSGLSKHNIRAEVDRYIAWPGQALGYKIGELKIRELRARAEKEMGDRFDIREFHDVVLRQGAVPLDILEGYVEDYIRSAK